MPTRGASGSIPAAVQAWRMVAPAATRSTATAKQSGGPILASLLGAPCQKAGDAPLSRACGRTASVKVNSTQVSSLSKGCAKHPQRTARCLQSLLERIPSLRPLNPPSHVASPRPFQPVLMRKVPRRCRPASVRCPVLGKGGTVSSRCCPRSCSFARQTSSVPPVWR